MILDSIDKSIQAICLSRPSYPLPFYITFTDSGALLNRPIESSQGTINEELTTVLSSPGFNNVTEQSYIKELKYLSISNTNIEPETVIFYAGLNQPLTQVFKCTLQSSWSAEYNYGQGWSIRNEVGVLVDSSDSLAKKKLLGQLNIPASVLTDAYVVQEGIEIELTNIFVCNNESTSTSFSLSVAIGGEADNIKQYLYKNLPVDANDTFLIEPDDVILSAGDVIRVSSGSSNLSITLFGKNIILPLSNES